LVLRLVGPAGLDWMMQVPKDLQNQLWQDLEQLERNRTMPYITSVERIGIEKGMQQGMQQGMRQGESALLERQLTRRFGPPQRGDTGSAAGRHRRTTGAMGRKHP
jgi:hypothetical protein